MPTDVQLEPIKQVLKHLRGLSEATFPGWREAPPPYRSHGSSTLQLTEGVQRGDGAAARSVISSRGLHVGYMEAAVSSFITLQLLLHTQAETGQF